MMMMMMMMMILIIIIIIITTIIIIIIIIIIIGNVFYIALFPKAKQRFTEFIRQKTNELKTYIE